MRKIAQPICMFLESPQDFRVRLFFIRDNSVSFWSYGGPKLALSKNVILGGHISETGGLWQFLSAPSNFSCKVTLK